MNRLRKLRPSGCGLILLAGVLFSSPAPAATNSPAAAPGRPGLQNLSLADAQRLAVQQNWDLLAAAAGVDVATAQKIVAHEFPNPTLSISTAHVSLDNHPNSTSEGNGLWQRSYDTIFAVNQLFEIGGKRHHRQASAQAGWEEARAQFLDARRTLDLGVAKAYIAAALAGENAEVLSASAATLHEEARLAAVRQNAGEISQADKEQIEITAERFEADAQAAQSAAAQARVGLEVLLGVARPNGACSLADRLEALVTEREVNTNSTGMWRPDVMQAEAAWRKAEADLRLQKANRIPDPTVLAQYEHNPSDLPNTAGFGVSLPLPLWNRNRGNILAATAAREQARLAFEKAKAQAAADIATGLLAYNEAARRWQRYKQSVRPKSERVRQTKAYAYQKGGASLLDMLVAERDDNEVRLAALQAASDAANAMAGLKAATFEMKPSDRKP